MKTLNAYLDEATDLMPGLFTCAIVNLMAVVVYAAQDEWQKAAFSLLLAAGLGLGSFEMWRHRAARAAAEAR